MEDNMSEQDNNQGTTEAEAPVVDQQENTDAPELGDAGVKAIKAERDARKNAERQAAALQAKLDEFEQANLSELEKAQRQATEAQTELERLRLDATRSRVALDKGVPADLLDFLTGTDEDEIAAKADTLMARLNTPATPRPDPSQGAKPVEDLSVAERAARAEQSGDRASAAHLKALQLGALAHNQN